VSAQQLDQTNAADASSRPLHTESNGDRLLTQRVIAQAGDGVAALPHRRGNVTLPQSGAMPLPLVQRIPNLGHPVESASASDQRARRVGGGVSQAPTGERTRAMTHSEPYATSPIMQMVAAQSTLRQVVQRQVTVELEQRSQALVHHVDEQLQQMRQERNRTNHLAPSLALLTSDSVVQTLVRKIRAQLQDERFRAGYLR